MSGVKRLLQVDFTAAAGHRNMLTAYREFSVSPFHHRFLGTHRPSGSPAAYYRCLVGSRRLFLSARWPWSGRRLPNRHHRCLLPYAEFVGERLPKQGRGRQHPCRPGIQKNWRGGKDTTSNSWAGPSSCTVGPRFFSRAYWSAARFTHTNSLSFRANMHFSANAG